MPFQVSLLCLHFKTSSLSIGPKAHGAFAATDNGYARFNHVRIPKDHMLSKFAQVTDEGEYIQPPHAKLSYGGVRLFPFFLLQMKAKIAILVLFWVRCCISEQSTSLIFSTNYPYKPTSL
jgi:hypothetical protein